MIIDSTASANISGISGVPFPSGDIEAAESKPDNEAAEKVSSRAPLADGLGEKVDLTV